MQWNEKQRTHQGWSIKQICLLSFFIKVYDWFVYYYWFKQIEFHLIYPLFLFTLQLKLFPKIAND